MTPDQVLFFKAALVSSIEVHLQNGGVISESRFVYNNERCPIACLAHEEKIAKDITFYDDAVASKLGFTITTAEVWSVIDGFDNTKSKFVGNELYEFGLELRRKYLRV